MLSLKAYVRTLNLFQPPEGAEEHEDDYEEHTNVIATRIYLIILVIILLGITLAISLIPYTSIITVKNPTQTQFESLPDSTTCPCSHISLSLNEFVSIETTFHQLCSSDFVSNQWILSLYFGNTSVHFLPVDFRSSAFVHFQALANFCRLSQANVNASLSAIGSTSFISPRILSEPVFRLQIEGIINRFILTTPNTFKTQMALISAVIINNQLMNGLGTSNFLGYGFDGFKRIVQIQSYTYLTGDGGYCDCMASPLCQGPLGFYYELYDYASLFPAISLIMNIPGLRVGCMPIDSILSSSLECFYDQSCIHAISPYFNITTNLTAMDIRIPSRFSINSTIRMIVNEFMVENWNFNISYEKYYNQCAPASCTYSKIEQRRFLYVLTTLIGLLGGLCAGLGVILPPIVHFIRRRRSATDDVSTPHISLIERLRGIKILLYHTLVELNLFKIYPSDHHQIFRQRIISRIYIILILLFFVIFTFYSSIRQEIHQETVYDPSESQFFYLQSAYPMSLHCPCSSISIPYNVSLTIEPHYHQLCSSDLISEDSLTWFSFFTPIGDTYLEFGNTVTTHLNTLATLCQLAEKTITDALQLFLREEFVTSEILSKELFDLQANKLIADWQKGLINNFLRTFQFIRVIQQGNHLGTAYSNFMVDSDDSGDLLFYSTDFNSENCTCLLSLTCRSLTGVYQIDDTGYYLNNTLLFVVPGFYTGCFKVEAFLASTLECFYSQDCMDSLNSALLQRYQVMINQTLLNASLSQTNETMGSIVNRLFVDKWSSNISFSTYYQTCLPRSCTFEKIYRNSFLSILITAISIFGGLTTSLKILFFILVRILMKIRGNQSFSANLDLVNVWFRNLLNRERLTNRLRNLVLFVILILLFFLSLFARQNQTKQYLKPSLEIYQQLFQQFPTALQCPCSTLSIEYQNFMNITVVRQHQICSSEFVSNQWFAQLIAPNHLSAYSVFDFRNAAISHFQLIGFLCQLTQQHLNDTLFDFARRNFISSQLLSSIIFDDQTQSTITEFQLTTFNSFLITLQLIRDVINSNMLIPVFQTSWKWIGPIDIPPQGYTKIVRTEPMTYGNCTCDLSGQCVQPGTILNQSILGLMVGCYPLESLLKSTFECLYDATCFSALQISDELFTPLNISLVSRYSINSTVESILDKLMIEEWSRSISYEKYYNACAPSYCSYSYLEYSSAIEIFTNLLGLYGGLMIITNVIAVLSVTLWQRTIQRRNNRIQNRAVTMIVQEIGE